MAKFYAEGMAVRFAEVTNADMIKILKHLADEIAALKLHPATGEEHDAGYIAARNDAFAIIQEAIDNAE